MRVGEKRGSLDMVGLSVVRSELGVVSDTLELGAAGSLWI